MTPRIFVPRGPQPMMIDFLLSTPKASLWAGMGIGKTVSGLTVADALMTCGIGEPTLVLGPLRVARDTWPGEVQKWEHLRHLHITPLVGSRRVRDAAIRQRADVFTVNYEQLPWLVEQFEGRPWPFRTVIADEATRLKGFRGSVQTSKLGNEFIRSGGGVRTNALSMVARSTDRWYNLTGTPAANGYKDLWGQFWFLDQGARLGRTHGAFMARWFSTNEYTRRIEPNEGAEAQINRLIADITLAVNPKDWFDLKEPISNVVRVQLPESARKQYKQLETDMFTTLACGTELEVFNAAALTNKCRQFANGAVYLQAGKDDWAPVHDAKLDALESVVEEAGGDKMLVAYSFVSDKERILHRFKDAVDISTPRGYAEFEKGDKLLGVAHPKSLGHGVDGLQYVCNRAVYFGLDWDLELHQQILERIGPMRQMQAGLDRPVWITTIATDDTLDDSLMERHVSKRDTQDLLLEAMSRRKQ